MRIHLAPFTLAECERFADVAGLNMSRKEIAEAYMVMGGVLSQVYSWTYRPAKKEESGAQIDLLIDRKDQVVNLCEMKFSDDEFQMTAKEEERLRQRRNVFSTVTKTRKAVHITLVTTYGLKRTAYAGIIQQVVTLEDLFRE